MAGAVVSSEAREDMAEIWSHIAADNEGAADREIASFHERFTTLAENAMAGRSRAELLPNIRSFAAGSYTLFYCPQEDGVEIVRVIHGARDITTLFQAGNVLAFARSLEGTRQFGVARSVIRVRTEVELPELRFVLLDSLALTV